MIVSLNHRSKRGQEYLVSLIGVGTLIHHVEVVVDVVSNSFLASGAELLGSFRHLPLDVESVEVARFRRAVILGTLKRSERVVNLTAFEPIDGKFLEMFEQDVPAY